MMSLARSSSAQPAGIKTALVGLTLRRAILDQTAARIVADAQKPALHARPPAAANDKRVDAGVAPAVAARILEEAIDVLERAVLDREVCKPARRRETRRCRCRENRNERNGGGWRRAAA